MPRTRRGGRRLPKRRPIMRRRSGRRSMTIRRRPAALRSVPAWMPRDAILSAEGASTMDIGLTQLPSFNARSCLNAGTYGTMGVGLGQAIAACVAHPDRPVIHLSGDSAIGFSGMEMETAARYNLPVKIVVLNNGGIGGGIPEFPDDRLGELPPRVLTYGARYDK